MRWHATASNNDGKLRHLRDGEAWKVFDKKNILNLHLIQEMSDLPWRRWF